MPVLSPTDHWGTVTWLGLVRDQSDGVASEAVESLTCDWGGPVGDVHHGLTRASCVRVKQQYPRSTEIANVRQLSIVSAEEVAVIATALGLERLDPAWLGATVVVEGIPSLTMVPPAARLMVEEGPALVVDMENAPCRFPAAEIEKAHPGHGAAFPKVARQKRGVTAWVERPGTLRLGQRLRLHLPPARDWPHR
ncbi:MAG: sulfurase [Pseudomonadota bacterium]